MVQKGRQYPLTQIGSNLRHTRQPRPVGGVICQFLQPVVAYPQQPGLLQVGLHDAPSPTQILQSPVLEYANNGFPAPLQTWPAVYRRRQKVGRIHVQRRKNGVPHFLKTQFRLLRQRRHQPGANLRRLHEVVKMPRL